MKLWKRLAAGLLAVVTAIGAAISAGAEPEASSRIEAYAASDFTYEENDTGITITDYNGSDSVVTIPSEIDGKRVTEIGYSAFSACYNLTSVIIPNTVTSIGTYAFNYCYNLISVTIPNSVTKIGAAVFRHCESLTSITIPDSVTSFDDQVFSYCESLTDVVIPDGVTKIGMDTFFNCEKLTNITIPNSVTEIGFRAFYGCTSLNSLTIPDSVTLINASAFGNCKNLISVSVAANNPNYTSVSGILYSKDGETLIAYPEGNGEDFTIPDGVIAIGKDAFYHCTSLKSVMIPNSVASIGNDAFMDCKNLASITIPSSVTEIGRSAFLRCVSLADVTIPDGVAKIDDGAFSDCTSLKSITIPNSVTEIDGNIFVGCVNLTNISVDSSNPAYTSVDGVLYSKNMNTLVSYPAGKTEEQFTIPDNMTTIRDSAFRSCGNLVSVTIPESVTSIEDYAFWDCDNLTSVTILNSDTLIEDTVYTEYCTIYGYAGGAVEAYANQNNIPFVAIGAISAPTFTPDGGTFTEVQMVTIACATEGVEIYYTIDGTAPTATSTKYTAPISITESVTLKAVAIKDGILSAVTSADFTINLSESQEQGFSSAGSSIADVPVNTVVTQKTAVSDGKYSERFVKKVAASEIEGKTKATFTLSNGTVTKTVSTTTYNTALTVDGETVSAGSGYVFLVYTLSGIPEDVTVAVGDVVLE